MGGAPGSHNIKIPPVNANKNCKVRAICFDFDLLTKSVAEAEKEAAALLAQSKLEDDRSSQASQPVLPNVGLIQDFAKLLNVQLGGDKPTAKEVVPSDDLSALLGDSTPPQRTDPRSVPKPAVDFADVRTKYAEKLRSRLDGGLAGVDHAKGRLAESLVKGDAAGHLAARQVAVKQGSTATRWMAMTGTGSMLQLLSNRSMQIVLLPKPSNIESEAEGVRMEQFTKQLPSVNFDLLVPEGKKVEVVLKGVMEELKLDPMHTMLVSDRDDYIVSAKDLGMVTCRVRPPNARRGNISAHYTIESIPDMQDLVNEINGISFNAVLNR
jgi:hypothetical protein